MSIVRSTAALGHRMAQGIRYETAEVKEAVREVWAFARVHDWKRTLRNVVQRKYWIWWALVIFTIITSTLLSHYHGAIITAIQPYKAIIRRAPAVWLIPIIVLIIVSFPPLFGHELIILVCGVIYSIPVAFAIACAGTFLGELACFYAARSLLSKRARKVETKSIVYACLAKLMREGGVKTSILVRFSAVPGHITTAIQSTIGISVWVYAIAAIVSLPKQFALVYVGYVFGENGLPIEQWRMIHPNEKDSVYYSADGSVVERRKISFIVFAATFLATFVAFMFIWMQIRKIRPSVVASMEAHRLALEAKLQNGETVSTSSEEDEGRNSGDEQEEVDSNDIEMSRSKLSFNNTLLDHRPSFVARDSAGSRLGLLSAGQPLGRMSSNTASISSLGFMSPSLPHLPLDGNSSGTNTPDEYFSSRNVMDKDLRRGSH